MTKLKKAMRKVLFLSAVLFWVVTSIWAVAIGTPLASAQVERCHGGSFDKGDGCICQVEGGKMGCFHDSSLCGGSCLYRNLGNDVYDCVCV